LAGWTATPGSGTVNASSGASWQGGPFVISNPATCSASSVAVPGCDAFSLTVVPPTGHYVVDISTATASGGDDYDLYVYDSAGNLVDSSATSGGQEGVTLSDPPAGTYQVVVQVYLVTPGSTYSGKAALRTVTADQVARAYHPVKVGPGFQGTPANKPANNVLGTPIVTQSTYVGRNAAEPTIGVSRSGTAFFAAGDFDSEVPGLARTEVMRSKDGGKTWQSVQPQLILGDTTEPPASLDPYIYLEEDTGRLFSIDLYGGCSWLLYSDNEGSLWHRNVAACGIPVNDHQTLYSAPPPAGIPTQGFPEVLYYCFNQVTSTACGRSLDGGDIFLPAGAPAFLGVDPTAGTNALCGGLSGQLMADSQGRVFLPKGHCGAPWVAVSTNAALTWQQVRVNDYISAADTHTAVTADAAGNLYYVWFDGQKHLPYLSISTDHGQTWGVPYMIAPPGVHEVNFPAIVAGDAGRIAITFPGTTSQGGSDPNRPWNSYLLVSTNMLSSNPLFIWSTANDPADPVHRGDCGPGRCAGMYDFLDIVVSPADGRFWATATDTCTGACVSGQAPADGAAGVAIRELKGPTLWAPTHKK
jgi:hypothetical protein